MKILLSIIGIIGFFIALFLLNVGGSLFADFRTENLTGPGVDVFLLNRYPTLDNPLKLEVSARGGSNAGIYKVVATTHDGYTFSFTGQGITWGDHVIDNGRGTDDLSVTIPIDKAVNVSNGKKEINLLMDVSYVCAMSKKVRQFRNEDKQDLINIHLPVYTGPEKSAAQFLDLLKATAMYAAWIFLMFLAMAWIDKDEGDWRDAGSKPRNTDLEAYFFMGFFFSGCIIGYYVFAKYVASIFSITNSFFLFFLMLIWIAAAVIGWKLNRMMSYARSNS